MPEPLFNTAEQAARWRLERIGVLEAVLATKRHELADCTRDGQRLSQLLAEEEDTTEALEAALHALVAKQREVEGWLTSCDFCGTGIRRADASRWELGHAPDCPWAKARALLQKESTGD